MKLKQEQLEKMLKRTENKIKFKKCCNVRCKNNEKLENNLLPILEFYKNKSSAGGFGHYCKVCAKEINKKYYIRHRNEVNKHWKLWYSKNKKVVSDYRKRNKEKYAIWTHNYYKKNKKHLIEVARKNRNRNPELRISSSLRARFNSAFRGSIENKKAHTFSGLGCSWKSFMKRVEKRWSRGMSWKNYGNKKGQWSIDHIVPISKFDLINLGCQTWCNHFTNLRPLWHKDNLSKGVRFES